MLETNEKRYHILKYSSMVYRLTQAYFNSELAGTGIGAGQQYFLDRIALNPGIGVTQLAQTAGFDNGTSAKAVKRLIDEGLVRAEADGSDGRVKRLYATEAAAEVVCRIRAMKTRWREIVTDGFTADEKQLTADMLKRLAENALKAVNPPRESEGGE